VDAAGGQVEIGGGYGQGVLIVVGGDLRITGTTRFAGLVLVDGSVTIDGGAHVDGAVLATGGAAPAGASTLGGDAALRFDPCALERAAQSLTRQKLNDADQMLETPLFGWYEVVR
jgi:hypothetical protein